jgi:hypothetical protein
MLPNSGLSFTVLILESKTSVLWKSDYMLFPVMCPMDLLLCCGWGGVDSCRSQLTLPFNVSLQAFILGS